jgi:hypothetical protein
LADDYPRLRPGADWGRSDCTDPQGRFEITSVAEGEYVLGANQNDKPSARRPFRRIFYPSVPDRERAVVLHVGPGELIENLDLVIPRLVETITVKGVLRYSDGNPAVDQTVKFKIPQTNDKVDGDVSEQTDSEGRFSLTILKGLTGELAGEAWLLKGYYKECPKVDEILVKAGSSNVTVRTNVITLTAEENVFDLELTLPSPRCEKAKR